MTKKILVSILFIALTLGISPTSVHAFSDVSVDNRNSDAITYVKDQGIVSGYADGSYKPESTVNRAEFTKILIGAQFDSSEIEGCIAKNLPAGSTYVFFKDVAIDAWYAKYVCVAKVKNVVSGYADGTFRPTASIAFVESAKMISNTFDFSVATDANIWYKPFVEALAAKRAIPATILDLDKKITRGDLAEMVWRVDDERKLMESVSYNDLTQTRGDVTVAVNDTHTGSIIVKEGNVKISTNATVDGDISIAKGTLTIESNVTINGKIRVIDGDVTLNENGTITGDFITERGNIKLGNNNDFGGSVETLLGNLDLGHNNTFTGIVQIGSKNVVDPKHIPEGDLTGGTSNTFGDYLKTPKGNITLGDNTTVKKSAIALDGKITFGNNATVDETIGASKTVEIGVNSTVTGQIDAAGGVTIGDNSTIGSLSNKTTVLKQGSNVTIKNK